jgi:hypothetical protein
MIIRGVASQPGRKKDLAQEPPHDAIPVLAEKLLKIRG